MTANVLIFFYDLGGDFNKWASLSSLRMQDGIRLRMFLKVFWNGSLAIRWVSFHSIIYINSIDTIFSVSLCVETSAVQASWSSIISVGKRNSGDTNFPPLLLDTWPAFFPTG